MAPIIGYSNMRVNSIDTTSDKDEFAKWMHGPNFKAIKTATAQAIESRTSEKPTSFAALLKQADQDNQKPQKVELRPANRLAPLGLLGHVDILA